MEQYNIGIDCGGTNIKFAIVSQSGKVFEKHKIKTPLTSAEEFVSAICVKISEIREKYEINGIGLGIPGRIDKLHGIVNEAVNLPATGLNIKNELENATGLIVSVDNDAACATFGEYAMIAKEKIYNMIYMSLGTGVGGGIIINGVSYRGGDNTGGEIGHICTHVGGKRCNCGRSGCLEAYASVRALMRNGEAAAKEAKDGLLPDEITSAAQIIDAANSGSKAARAVLDDYLEEVKAGVTSVDMIFAPDAIVVGGGICENEDFCRMLLEKCENSKLRISLLRNDAGMVGAAAMRGWED